MKPAQTYAFGDSTYVLAIDYNAAVAKNVQTEWINAHTMVILARLAQVGGDERTEQEIISGARDAAEREWHDRHTDYPEIL